MFTIKIKTDNAAFEPSAHEEIARILFEVRNRIKSGEGAGTIRDINGNKVGCFTLKLEA